MTERNAAVTHDNFEPMRALIVDDSKLDQMFVRRQLELMWVGLAIDEVSSVAELKERLHGQRYDLIIVDFFLPDGDGNDVLDIIFSKQDTKNVATLMVSGATREQLSKLSRHLDRVEVVEKKELQKSTMGKAALRAVRASSLGIGPIEGTSAQGTEPREQVATITDY